MKTADEMFRELNYSKSHDVDGNLIYIHETQLKMIAVRDRTCVARWNLPGGWKDTRMAFEEILACAQLIREMGCAE